MSQTKAQRRRQNEARPPNYCEHCRGRGEFVHVRTATVRMGMAQRERRLLIDRWPHPEGRVIKSDDGTMTLLPPGTRPMPPGGFRWHSEFNCATQDWLGVREAIKRQVEHALNTVS